MKILLLSSAYNGLSQRAHVELESAGHQVSIALALNPDYISQTVALVQPDLILCPFLKEKIPEAIWSNHTCLIVHPGIVGDRGPSSLDWAIMNNEREWGVTVLQAAEEMDAGDIWATETFTMRKASKASLYRREVTTAAVKAMLLAVERFAFKTFKPEPLDYSKATVRGKMRPLMKQQERKINWKADNVATIIKKINAADSAPGVLNVIDNQEYYLYGAHQENSITSWKRFFKGWKPGDIIAKRHGAICCAAIDGALWITHLKRKKNPNSPLDGSLSNDQQFSFKLPATMVLGSLVKDIPDARIDPLYTGSKLTFKEIWYEEQNKVGYLHFDFHNGAMSTEQCSRLLNAYRLAAARPTKVLVLMGGKDFWSNGIHLNIIEAADDPSEESWLNINAINDFVLEILTTQNKLTVSAVWGNCGAGGAMAILAADRVWARSGAVFNPHYKGMGLYGSEYWTYSLPKRVGSHMAQKLTESVLPIGTQKAKAIGFIDDILADSYPEYILQVRQQAEQMASRPDYAEMLEQKRQTRRNEEYLMPLADYRAAELEKMKVNFSGTPAPGEINYHQARYNFVHKASPKETSACVIRHSIRNEAKLAELEQAVVY